MSSCTYAGTQYSEGALICANGRELRCSGGEWKETGFACGKAGRVEMDFPEISEAEKSQYSESEDKPANEVGLSKVYAQHFSIRQDLYYYYFRGANTPTHACADTPGHVLNYMVAKAVVKKFGPSLSCRVSGGWYREIVFDPMG